MSNMVHCQLWMGGLEPYMTESFILASFQRMGEKPLNVKVMRNKFTGEPAGYCFVHFENDEEAIDAMHKLNGKVIPNTSPAVRFRLNTATNQGKIVMNEREFSLWVGDLTSDVDDYTLYKCFAAKYTSIKAAKVILDAAGHSKGFGFLRFGLEDEQKHCIVHMNGYKGLGLKPLKISNAIPKNQRNSSSSNGTTNLLANIQLPVPDYSQYYQEASYWQNYSQWGYGYDANSSNYGYDANQYNQQYGSQYNQQYPQQQQQQYGQQYSQQYPQYSQQQQQYSQYYQQPATQPQQIQAATISASTTVPTSISQPTVDDSIEVVDHSAPIDVDKENREYSESVLSFWDEVASVGYTNPEFYEMEVARLKVSGIAPPN